MYTATRDQTKQAVEILNKCPLTKKQLFQLSIDRGWKLGAESQVFYNLIMSAREDRIPREDGYVARAVNFLLENKDELVTSTRIDLRVQEPNARKPKLLSATAPIEVVQPAKEDQPLPVAQPAKGQALPSSITKLVEEGQRVIEAYWTDEVVKATKVFGEVLMKSYAAVLPECTGAVLTRLNELAAEHLNPEELASARRFGLNNTSSELVH